MDVSGQFPGPVALPPVKVPYRYPMNIIEYEAVWAQGRWTVWKKRKVDGVCRGSNLHEVVHLLLYFERSTKQNHSN